VTDWMQIYTPLIGCKLEAVIWMPMTSDTPQLLTEFKSAAFSFTGAVFLAFDDSKDLFLTWTQVGQNMVLAGGREYVWANYALDRVRVDPNEPWAGIESSTLKSVDLFSAAFIDGERVVGVRHVVHSNGLDRHLWIGTGGPNFIGDMDDLWVGVDIDPPNFADLIPAGAIGR
jgi:hypothetical protein